MSVVGLVRHRLTETVGSSVGTVFSTIQRATARRFKARLLPPYLDALPEAERLRGWREFLTGCDVVVAPSPGFIHTFRDQQGLPFRFVLTPLGSFPRGALNYRRSAAHLRPGDGIVFSSQADRAIFNRMFTGCPAEQWVIPFPVDHRRFRPPTQLRRRELRRRFGFSDDDVVFLYVGRVTAEKNVHTTLALLDALIARQPRARLLLVGRLADEKFREFDTGPFDLEAIVRSMLANSERLARRVTLVPWTHRDLLPHLYGLADVFLNLTLHHDENFGYGQVEAMGCGLPVVGTDWGGLKDTIADGSTGFRIPTRVSGRGIQIDRLRAIEACEALMSPERRHEMGAAARQRVLDEYTFDLFERRWAEAVSYGDIPTSYGGARARDGGVTQLTDFGRRLDQAFDGRQPLYTPETYPLYRELIEPYGTGPVEPHRGEVLFLLPLSFEVDDQAIEVRDPLWPGRFPIDHLQRRIVGALEDHELDSASPFMTRPALEAALLDHPPPSIGSALAGLVEAGLVGRSSPSC
jgi:glycosyltransferase involved in cell wall biosynthesis